VLALVARRSRLRWHRGCRITSTNSHHRDESDRHEMSAAFGLFMTFAAAQEGLQ